MNVNKYRWKKIRKSITSYISQQEELTVSRLHDCIETYFEKNMYPLRIDNHEIVRLISDNPDEDDLRLVELKALYLRDKSSKDAVRCRKILFKRFVPASMVENMSLEDIISRRKLGITIEADDCLAEAKKRGYTTIDEMYSAYETAKKIADDLTIPVLWYVELSDEEKKAITNTTAI